jgi:hypothetical protein
MVLIPTGPVARFQRKGLAKSSARFGDLAFQSFAKTASRDEIGA